MDTKLIEDFEAELAAHSASLEKAGELLNRQDALIKELHAAYEAETESTALMMKRITELEAQLGEMIEVARQLQNTSASRYESSCQRHGPEPHPYCVECYKDALASESQRTAAGTADEKPDGQAENAEVKCGEPAA